MYYNYKLANSSTWIIRKVLIFNYSCQRERLTNQKWISKYLQFWLHLFYLQCVLLHQHQRHNRKKSVRISRKPQNLLVALIIYQFLLINSILFEYFFSFGMTYEDDSAEQFVSCDIIGSDAVCAINCIRKGFRGGYCNDKKVCVCRR